MSQPADQNILNEYKNSLQSILKQRLVKVLLFGSRARGNTEPSSDIDVLCVIDGPFDYGQMIRETSEATSEISLKHDVVLSRTFVSEWDYLHRNLPFMMNVRKEGIPL